MRKLKLTLAKKLEQKESSRKSERIARNKEDKGDIAGPSNKKKIKDTATSKIATITSREKRKVEKKDPAITI